MNVYLPIEIKVRELEGKLLLALIAAEKGHTVILGEKKDTLNLAKTDYLPPGIVHDKSLTPGEYKIKYLALLKEHGHLITSQDEESGIVDESYETFAKRRYSEETVSMADKIFTWGKHDQFTLQKIYPEYAKKIVATGSPRVDFWRKDLDEYYKDSVTDLDSYIFIASNFGFPIDENPFWNRVARLRQTGYFDRDPEMERFMYENTAYQYRLLHEFVLMIRNLSEEFPNRKIVVRPHPVESVDAWHKLLGEIPNVMIKREGTISGWIRNASVLIHNGCTSAIEAFVSGLPRIAYRPIPHEKEREIPNKISIQAFDLKELKEIVNNILTKGSAMSYEESEKIANDMIAYRLSNLSNTLAAETIVQEWEKMANEKNLETANALDLARNKPEEKVSLKLKLKSRAVKVRNLFLNIPEETIKSKNLLSSSHKFPSLHDDEINEMIRKLQHTLQRFDNVNTVRFGEKSFIFYNGK